jgi:hypothetical protein
MESRLTIVVTARVPSAGVADFNAYEAGVLPLLDDHGGRLERRLVGEEGRVEVHIVSFATRDGFDAYRRDPRRADLAALLERSGATVSVVEMRDVNGGPNARAR